MSHSKRYFYLLFIMGVMFFSMCKLRKPLYMKPPAAEKIRKELISKGHSRIDNYYWLNERDNQKVIQYLNAENEYTDYVMSDYKEMRNNLFKEIVGRIKQTDESVPYRKNGYFFYTRYEEGKEYPVYCRKKDNQGSAEEILLNVNELAAGHKYCHVSSISCSRDNRLLAYGLDTVGRRLYIIYFKDIITGRLFDITIPNSTGSITWANDNKTVFYACKDVETLRACKVFRHKLGSDIEKDKEIFFENDSTFNTLVYKTKSERYIVICSHGNTSTEFQITDADNPGEFKVFQPREKDHEYAIDYFRNKFYVITNWNAKNFRLMETEADKTGKENWKELIPHRKDVLIEDIEIFNKFMVIAERKDGLNQMRIINWDDHKEHYLDFGEEVYTASFAANYEFDTDWLRYSYSSLTTPNSVYDYNLVTGEKKLLKQQEVVGTFNPGNYEAKRLYAPSRDGKKIPLSLVYRKGIILNGENPLMLYGYGAYGITIEPNFSSVRLSLLDRGFVYAIAHIRGEHIYGREWYEDGKLLNKKNTFNDFIDCAEYLIQSNYTVKDKLFAHGGSAGGLLMGAVSNMRPDLFRGIIADVPFVDVLTTMLDDKIPLTTGEYDEWGNPNEEKYYNYILSYSPYDNVKAVDYPAMLIITGLHDSQVQYWEPAKWVAKLRATKTDNHPLILFTNMDAGHGGASGRFEIYKESALEYAFIFKLLGIKK